MEITLNTDVQYLKGVGPLSKDKLNKMGIYTIQDLLEYYPRVYEDRTTLRKIAEFVDSENVLFTAKVDGNVQGKYLNKRLTIQKVIVTDDTGSCMLTFFNKPFLKDNLKNNVEYVFYGKVNYEYGKVNIENPNIYNKYELLRIMGLYPIYPLVNGITQKFLFNIISNLLLRDFKLDDMLNDDIKKKYNLCDKNYAVEKIHLPKTYNEINIARKRLIFEELFLFTTVLRLIKEKNNLQKKSNTYTNLDITKFLELLPYKLTNAQNKVINDILNDIKSNKNINRMIQGDVGSGKTIVAAIAMYISVTNGYQTCIMAPTTILANQHYIELSNYFNKLNIKCEILTSNNTKKQKEKIIESLKNGEIDILFGTHSLIEDNVEFKNLGLVITDEQHRFGVKQRMKLSNKGLSVDTLVMTATPIPRTLALMLYGDLDLSVIDELPPGRQKIETFVVDDTYESRINSFIAKQIDLGRQVYVVCPLIENNEDMDDLKSVEKIYEKYINSELSGYKIAVIHGKMKSKEKDDIMVKFKNKEYDILISTTVIEVGVNVPNATLMVIENADRFGLAALHQLRGRVGRGSEASYCVLKYTIKSKKVMERLKIMEKSNDGFEIAGKDLDLRGPGDFFGIRQSGLPEFKLADLLSDIKLLELAQIVSKDILDKDPKLQLKENYNLKKSIYFKFKDQIENITM
jgi:ATP-dependent DNA helicase RecG